MITLPDRLPSLAGDLPREVRNMLMEKLWLQHVELRGGVFGLIESLYRGELRVDGLRVSYMAPAHQCWGLIVDDTHRFMAKRDAERDARRQQDIPFPPPETHA